MELGDRIVELRQQNKMNQKDLANALGISQQYLWMIEKNKRLCSMEIINHICEIFEISLLDFFDANKKNNLKTRKILTICEKLSDKDLNLLIDIATKIYQASAQESPKLQ